MNSTQPTTPKPPGPIARAIAGLKRRSELQAENAELRRKLAGRTRLSSGADGVRAQARAVLDATSEPVTEAGLEHLARLAKTSKPHWLAYESARRRFVAQQQETAAKRTVSLQQQLETIPPGAQRSAFFKQHRSELGF
jgi:hypothetical protein